MFRHTVLALLVVNMWVFSARAGDKMENSNAATHYRKAFSLLPKLTDADKEILDQVLTTPLEDKAGDLIKRSEPVLQELHRGAALKECDWEWNLSKYFDQVGEVLGKTSDLGKLAYLRACYYFQHNQGRAAVDDLIAVLVMSRHIGKDGPFMSQLVQFAVEQGAVDVAATHLPQQNAKTLKILRERLDALPKASTLKDGILQEKEFVRHWYRPEIEKLGTKVTYDGLRKIGHTEEEAKAILKAAGEDVKDVLKLVDDAVSHYNELANIATLPIEEFKPALDAYKKKHEAANPLATSIVPSIASMRDAHARIEVRMLMLKTALAIVLDGPEQLKKIKDPFGDGPFTYEKREGSFELKSKLQIKNLPPVSLTVGKVKKD